MITNLIYFFFLFPIAVIGIICAYTDIKYNKIFNKWIILGFIYIFLLYVSLFFLGEKVYVLKLFLNGIISFSVGFLLWSFRLWSSGDTKLFTLYAFLVPLDFYSKSFIFYFPSFNLLVNLFIPLLFVLIINALITTLKELYKFKKTKQELKFPKINKIFQICLFLLKLFLSYVFVFIVLNLFIIPLAKEFPIGELFNNPFIIFIFLLFTIKTFNEKRRDKKWLDWLIYGIIFGYFSWLIFLGEYSRLMLILKVSLVFMIFVGLTRVILSFYIQKKETKKIKVKDIKEGMVLVEGEFFSFINKFKKDFGFLDAGGINKSQLSLIKKIFKNSEKLDVKIYKTLPFAPFLFLSAVISVITKSSFLVLLDRIFQYFL
jgi:Flp pilus assembly protein protease CpaA